MGTKDIFLEHFGRITSSPLGNLSFLSHEMGGRHGLGSILLDLGRVIMGEPLQSSLSSTFYIM